MAYLVAQGWDPKDVDLRNLLHDSGTRLQVTLATSPWAANSRKMAPNHMAQVAANSCSVPAGPRLELRSGSQTVRFGANSSMSTIEQQPRSAERGQQLAQACTPAAVFPLLRNSSSPCGRPNWSTFWPALRTLTAEEAADFRRFCRLWEGLVHRDLQTALEELKNAYAAFDPDADTRPGGELTTGNSTSGDGPCSKSSSG